MDCNIIVDQKIGRPKLSGSELNRKIAVVFDLEDTLVETPWSNREHRLEFRAKTKQKLIHLGIPMSVLAGIERATVMRNKASEYAEQMFGRSEAERFKLQMDKFLSLYEQDSARKSRLFADTIPTLKSIRTLSVGMALVTNTSAEAVKVVFQAHPIKQYFDAVITRENIKRLKPDPEGILLALKLLSANTFFMVGDLVLDVLAAKKADGKSILVRRPGQSDSQDPHIGLPSGFPESSKGILDEESSFGADYTVQSLAEVPTIIQNDMILRKSQT